MTPHGRAGLLLAAFALKPTHDHQTRLRHCLPAGLAGCLRSSMLLTLQRSPSCRLSADSAERPASRVLVVTERGSERSIASIGPHA